MKTRHLFVWLMLVGLSTAENIKSQQLWQPSNAEAEDDHERRLAEMRERGAAIRRRLAEESREREQRTLLERRQALERRQEEARSNVERLRYGYGTYALPRGSYAVPRITPNPGYYYRRSAYSSYSANYSEECEDEKARAEERARQEEEEYGFAAASGKCGDVTTQKIGNFYYHSNGGVTQRIGSFFYGPDGQVTQKIGNFYHHSDGTTTQRIGNFFYDSDGGVTQKIGSFYYHSGGRPCDEEKGTNE